MRPTLRADRKWKEGNKGGEKGLTGRQGGEEEIEQAPPQGTQTWIRKKKERKRTERTFRCTEMESKKKKKNCRHRKRNL